MIPDGSQSTSCSQASLEAAAGQAQSRWVFRKNCALTPRQLMAWYLAICGLTLLIASGFLLAGYWVVLPFAGLELLVLGGAFLMYARHANDFEMIEVRPDALRLVFAHGAQQTEICLSPGWVRLSYDGRFKAPLTISCKGQHVKIGKFIADKDKPALLKELRQALEGATGMVRSVAM